MKPLLVTSGEPAGIGPDICLALAQHKLPVVVLGDINVLQQRAAQLKLQITFIEHRPGNDLPVPGDSLAVLPISCPQSVIAGRLTSKNASYVLDMLDYAIKQCLLRNYAGVVTAPVHKAVISQAGFKFSGHTEYLQNACQAKHVVMLLANQIMKVALVTTHLPLKAVSKAITQELIVEIIQCLHKGLKKDFNLLHPKIVVAGLNPHAGEAGCLGLEEIEIIEPALEQLRALNINVHGPVPADTMFLQDSDAYVGMYHDQVLPIIKYVDFHQGVNITLGLPIIRTSVDHGTALDLAGTGKANPASLIAAVKTALDIAKNRDAYDKN
jgi:4-hydroxythreonine-4-phosphate dehydrogenase